MQELEKASDVTSQENGLLRAQVQRLQTELREYRKRLSLNSTSMNRSPPPASGFSSLLNNNNNNNNNFSFDFPRFGGLPGTQFLDNGPLSKTKNTSVSSSVSGRHNSTGRSISPTSQANGAMTRSPNQMGSSPSVNDAQRSGSLNSIYGVNSPPPNTNINNADGFTKSPSRVFQFNSGSSSHSDSPSTSSTSPNALDSSCDTSPAPSHSSPNQQKDTAVDGYINQGNPEGEISFCEKLNMACGNCRDPVPRAMTLSNNKTSSAGFNYKSPNPAFDGLGFFANQNGGQFDPSLFGDYRDTQNAIIGDGDFTNGFFNDAFLNAGYASPFHFGDTPLVPKPNPLEEIERIQNGEEEVVPGEDPTSMLNCHKIWFVFLSTLPHTSILTSDRDKLSSRPDFKDGTIDIDNLCSELRAKARCSESGVVVNHKDVENALKRLPADKAIV